MIKIDSENAYGPRTIWVVDLYNPKWKEWTDAATIHKTVESAIAQAQLNLFNDTRYSEANIWPRLLRD